MDTNPRPRREEPDLAALADRLSLAGRPQPLTRYEIKAAGLQWSVLSGVLGIVSALFFLVQGGVGLGEMIDTGRTGIDRLGGIGGPFVWVPLVLLLFGLGTLNRRRRRAVVAEEGITLDPGREKDRWTHEWRTLEEVGWFPDPESRGMTLVLRPRGAPDSALETLRIAVHGQENRDEMAHVLHDACARFGLRFSTEPGDFDMDHGVRRALRWLRD